MSDDRARRAKRLRNSPHAADRAESERIFRELRDEAHSGAAPLVLDDLSDAPLIHLPRRQDPALVAMASEWLSFRSPMHSSPLDYRFVRWFAEAERQPEVFEEFAASMVASVTDWLPEYERLSNAVSAGEDDPRLRHFDEWMELATSHPTIAAALVDLRERWHELQSRRLLVAHTREIEEALERGNLNAAKNGLAEIAESPHVPQIGRAHV